VTQPGADPARWAAVLWDLDGTLADSEPLHAIALAAPFEAEGLAPPADLHAQAFGRSAQEIHAFCRSSGGLRMDYDEWIALRWRCYLSRAAGLQPREGALAAFTALQHQGCRQAVVSNSDRVIVDANLAAIGLAGRFDAVLSREDFSRPKPHPDPYLTAVARLGLDPSAVAVVEDSFAGASAGVAA